MGRHHASKAIVPHTASGLAQQASSQVRAFNSISAVLRVDTQYDRVVLHLTLSSPATASQIRLEPWHIFAPNSMFNDADVVLRSEAQPVDYLGPVAKRKATDWNQLIPLSAGQTITGQQNVTSLYAWKPGTHTYSATYQAFVASSPDTWVTLQSQPVTFTLSR